MPSLHFSANTARTVHAVTTRRALISIRPKAAISGNRVSILIAEVNLLVHTQDALIELVYDPQFVGTPVWIDPSPLSNTEYSIHTDLSAGAFTAGTVFQSYYAVEGQGSHPQTTARGQDRWFPVMRAPNEPLVALSVVGTTMAINPQQAANIAAAVDFEELF